MNDLRLTRHRKMPSLRQAIATRMSGPGGLYNLGNVIGFASGIGFALIGARGAGGADGLAVAAFNHLAGSGGAIALSIAMVLFFISGEFYHRAYQAMQPGVSAKLLKRADALSGVAALFLAVSLVLFGDIWMAITSTVLLAGGKFGNAILPPNKTQIRLEYPALSGAMHKREIDFFRLAVILSRIPAMLGLLIGLTAQWPELALLEDGPTATLLGCYCLWLWADLVLAKN